MTENLFAKIDELTRKRNRALDAVRSPQGGHHQDQEDTARVALMQRQTEIERLIRRGVAPTVIQRHLASIGGNR